MVAVNSRYSSGDDPEWQGDQLINSALVLDAYIRLYPKLGADPEFHQRMDKAMEDALARIRDIGNELMEKGE